MQRFVFENRSDLNGERALYDIKRGRNVAVAMVDEEYVPVVEAALKALADQEEAASVP